ncbi:stage V sporulation protein D [Paenibacillus sp. J45TS6]|uniref:penicillin-binding transpeptidase domain-containing protein n=1 Tax=Paenibacillus sp. J45TS6 TaxID=2807196 RepID=UPI001B16FCC2|nr:penicillin-binding transpeptidase domain-containing protein [Paenibacillus sp. J45TS6]GIP41988.1 stage V sporulation protein D [Paenibacillus sp. J45TS6]
MGNTGKRIKLRTLLIGGIITLFFLVLIGKVFWIQVVDADTWKKHALELIDRTKTISAKRGTITDRNGDILAKDAPAYTVAVNPKLIAEKEIEDEVVKGLHNLLGKDEAGLRKDVTSTTDEGELRVHREVRSEGYKISQELKDQVEEFREKLDKEYGAKDAIILTEESKRFYPENNLASHVLGYLNKEDDPVYGLELYYDEKLKGQDGKMVYQADRKGVEINNSTVEYTPAVNGKNLTLTIDDTIQFYIEEAMKKAVDQYNPISMTVIAADPNTMEILGMANMPNYNPNTYWESEPKDFYNHAIQSIYEPGSTFKIVTLAGAVEEKLFNPNATYESGSVTVGGFTISDVSRNWGTITYLDGVKRSSNVAFVNLGYKMLGGEKLRSYIDKFGFGVKTGIDLPNESASPIRELHFASEIAAASYGHGLVQVTPLQQVAAVSAIANGGKLMVPHLVKEITDPNTGEVEKIEPEVVRQAISESTSKTVSGYLEQVVADQEKGSGRFAYIDGYRVAGKTGTAIKIVNGDYDHTKAVVSFIGFAPADNPKIAMIIVIDQPNDPSVGGGTAAAPVFKEIMSKSLTYLGVPKETASKDDTDKSKVVSKKAPDLVGKSGKEARSQLLDQGIAYETLGKGSEVVKQYPESGTALQPGQRVYLLTEDSDTMEVPDLTGESLRDALEVLTLIKVGVKVEGEGFVSEQKVEVSGEQRTVVLTLKSAKETVTGETGEDVLSSEEAEDVNKTEASTENEESAEKTVTEIADINELEGTTAEERGDN